MQYLKLYQQWRMISENVTDRESCFSKYGKILFGEQFAEDEKNTDSENHLIKLLKDFTGDKYGKNLSSEIITQLKELSKCLDVYPNVLKPKNVATFRGTEIKLGELLKYNIDDNLVISKFVYKPNYDVSSWSTNFEVAYDFASDRDLMDFDSTQTMGSFLNELFDTSNWTHWDSDTLKEQFETERFYKTARSYAKSDLTFSVVCVCENLDNTFLFNSEKFRKLSEVSGEEEVLKITKDPIPVKLYIGTGNSMILTPISDRRWKGKKGESLKFPIVVDDKLRRCQTNAKMTFDKIKYLLDNPSVDPTASKKKNDEDDDWSSVYKNIWD